VAGPQSEKAVEAVQGRCLCHEHPATPVHQGQRPLPADRHDDDTHVPGCPAVRPVFASRLTPETVSASLLRALPSPTVLPGSNASSQQIACADTLSEFSPPSHPLYLSLRTLLI
jgi:hypothetical protein